MASRKSREFYEQRLREVDGGASVADVARRHGIRAKTLSWWCWKLRQSGAKRSKEGTRARRAKKPELVPVVVRERMVARRGLVELSVDGIVLSFESGTDPDYLAALVSSLRGAC